MSTHTMDLTCNDCGYDDFCIAMEYYNRESLIEKANETKCPKCGSKNWSMGDGCDR